MGMLRHLQHWLNGQGPQLQTTEFVPETHPIRLWADTFPWDSIVDAVTQSFTQALSHKRARGVVARLACVLLALELLEPNWAGPTKAFVTTTHRCGGGVRCDIRNVQTDGCQSHFVLPETLTQFRRRIDQDLMDKLVAIQAAAAMEAGLVSPAHLLVDTFPS